MLISLFFVSDKKFPTSNFSFDITLKLNVLRIGIRIWWLIMMISVEWKSAWFWSRTIRLRDCNLNDGIGGFKMILNGDIVEGLGYHFRFRLIFKPISISVQLTRDNFVHPVSKGLSGQFYFRCADKLISTESSLGDFNAVVGLKHSVLATPCCIWGRIFHSNTFDSAIEVLLGTIAI